jgi:hypothetical protein
MSVWLTIPSARPPEQVEPILALWRNRGYKIALWLDQDRYEENAPRYSHHELVIGDGCKYPGYAQAVNHLIKTVMSIDLSAEWFVCAGDDTKPDLTHTAEDIAGDCLLHFSPLTGRELHETGTFGVMQPTGDRWGDAKGAYIDRVCGSPWIGREFARRMYGGNGPYWPEYTHMGVDEELQAVAVKYGVLWQRRGLIHLHQHWGRKKNAMVSDMPEFLRKANTPEHWQAYKKLFAERQAAGFPGSEPL